jgi:outer membrane protein OmpA-like peptidoglycan-associated protein
MLPSLDPHDLVRSENVDDTPEELLGRRPSVLLGVTAEAEALLDQLSIRTVFDLATSRVFRAAAEVAGATVGSDGGAALHGRAPGDLIDPGHRDNSVFELAQSRVDVLSDIDEELAEAMAAHLGVTRIRDLALWPPHRAARALLSRAYGVEPTDASADAPAELVPTARRYATEVFHYSKIFFDRIERGDVGLDLIELSDGGEGIDAGTVGIDDRGFVRPATGVLMRMAQHWIPQGLSLGQLLHSVALAPGESTKIAVIDWTRQTRTGTRESIEEGEQLDADIAQERSISEMQKGVAREVQSGFSMQTTSSEAYSEGGSSGGGLAGLLGGGSGNYGYSENDGTTLTVASSAGERSVTAEMQQNIQAATRQSSTVVRSRRASIVQETTQTEQETLRTRVLTNYNHSHALTMHYYEVVQIYRVGVRLDRWQRVLFLPMRTLDFGDPRVLARWAEALAPAAPPLYRQKLLELSGTVLVQQLNSVRRRPPSIRYEEDVSITAFGGASTMSGVRTVELHVLDSDEPVVLPFEGGLNELDEPIPIDRLDRIEVTYSVADGDLVPIATLAFRVRDPARPGTLRFFDLEVALPPSKDRLAVARVERPRPDPSLVTHLQREALRYSQVVWGSMSGRDVALLLSRYAFRGEPLAEVADMQPLTVFGNYLVLRYHADSADDERWLAWKRKHLESAGLEEDLIPVPTDGLFAEAILGRANASEKLDITRFWDWQESPIPMQAPDIGPLQAGQHAVASAAMPGQLGAATVGYQQPAGLPDPAGLGTLFDLMSSEIFRDMSGLEETAATLRESIETAGAGATEAARLATELEKVKQQTLGRIAEMAARAGLAAATGGASGVAGAAMQAGAAAASAGGGGGGGPLSRTGNSRTGALINEGSRMDTARHGGSTGGGGRASGGASGGGAGGGRAGPAPSGSPRSFQQEAFESAVSHAGGTLPFGIEHMSAGGDGAPLPPPVNAAGQTDRVPTDERQRAAATELVIERHATLSSPLGERHQWLVYDFAVDEASLDGPKEPLNPAWVLYERAVQLEQEHGIRVTYHVQGFTDATGPDERNTELRSERARVFVERATDKMLRLHEYFGTVKAAPMGEFVADNDTESGRARNRSVLVTETLTIIREERPPTSPDEIERLIEVAEQELAEKASQGSGYHAKLQKVLEYYGDPSRDMAIFSRASIDLYIQKDHSKSNPQSVPSWVPFELSGRRYLAEGFAHAQTTEEIIKEVEALNQLATDGYNYIVGYVGRFGTGTDPYSGAVHLRDHIAGKQRNPNTLYYVFARWGN